MAKFPTTANPAFSQTMDQITTQDRGHPDTFNPRYQVLLDNDNYLKGSVERRHNQRTITLTATGWSASYPYEQTLTVPDITADDNIKIIGVSIPDGSTLDQVKAWNKAAGFLMHSPGGVGAGSVTFKAYKKPVVDFAIITEGA